MLVLVHVLPYEQIIPVQKPEQCCLGGLALIQISGKPKHSLHKHEEAVWDGLQAHHQHLGNIEPRQTLSHPEPGIWISGRRKH